MKNNQLISLVLLLFILGVNQSQAQEFQAIEMKSSFWGGAKFYKDGKIMDLNSVKNSLSSNSEAFSLFNNGLKQQKTANIFGAIGGGLIGWPIGESIGGAEDPIWELAYIGAGVSVIGFIVGAGVKKKIKSALTIYNNQSIAYLDTRGSSIKQVKLGLGNFGLGIQIMW